MPAVASPEQQVSVTRPIKHKHKFLTPKLRLRLDELQDEGNESFLKHVDAAKDFEEQVQNVLNLLYDEKSTRPGTRSVTFVIRNFDGVAYTTGTELDDDHKEIHFSLGHIRRSTQHARQELLGVICHELVHCFQWNALGTAPGGLIEGIADWVRLNAGVGAVHWERKAGGQWDAGYQNTGFFLDYLEERFGHGTVLNINEQLRDKEYDESALWPSVCKGHSVQQLWKQYQETFEEMEGTPPQAIPTHPAKPR